MRVTHVSIPLLLVLGLACSTWSQASAQNEPTREPAAARQDNDNQDRARPDEGRAAGRARGFVLDDQFVNTCLRVDNETEVAVAKIAQQKAENEKVKQFAEKMAQAHGQFLEKLAGMPGGARRADPNRQVRDDQAVRIEQQDKSLRADQLAQNRGANRLQGETGRGAGTIQFAEFVQLKEELGEQCRMTIQAELERKSGPEFDRCYMAGQVFAHLAMWDGLTVFRKHASPEMQTVLAEALKTTEQHLQEARTIMKELDGEAARTASRSQPVE